VGIVPLRPADNSRSRNSRVRTCWPLVQAKPTPLIVELDLASAQFRSSAGMARGRCRDGNPACASRG
jgi:hypothetical protein